MTDAFDKALDTDAAKATYLRACLSELLSALQQQERGPAPINYMDYADGKLDRMRRSHQSLTEQIAQAERVQVACQEAQIALRRTRVA